MIATTNAIAKIAAVAAGLGLVAMSFASFAPAAKAATTAEQIAALMAQIAALQGGSASASVTFTMDLTIGSTGAEVTALQNWLISKGYSIPAGATGYFGAQTQSALAAYQAANGIAPAAGYFGPITRAKVNATAGSTTGGTTTTGGSTTLSGVGRLIHVDEAGDIESDLNEGDSNVQVIGLEAEAKDGDVQLQRLDVDFDLDDAITNGGSSRLSKYIDSASVYLDGKKLATMDADEADKSGTVRTLRFSNLGGIIKEGKVGEIYVAVDAVSTIGDAEDGEDIAVSIPADGLRAISGDGISETYSDGVDETFNVSTADSGTLTISEGSNNPDDSQVKVDADNTTTGVTLLAFKMKAKEQDVTITDLPISLGTSAGSLKDVVQSVKLKQGSKTLKSKSVTSTDDYAVVTFTDVNIDIDQDDTQDFSVVVDLKKATGYGADDTLVASTTKDLAGWDVEDAEGDAVNGSALKGSAVGGTVTFQTLGVNVSKDSTTTNKTPASGVSGAADSTQYSITFTVEAGDDDIWISKTLGTAGQSPAGTRMTWATTTSSDIGGSDQGSANLSASGTNSGDSSYGYKVNSGSSRQFTLNVTLSATSTTAKYTGVTLTGIGYADNQGGTSPNVYTANLDTFKTTDVSMKKNP